MCGGDSNRLLLPAMTTNTTNTGLTDSEQSWWWRLCLALPLDSVWVLVVAFIRRCCRDDISREIANYGILSLGAMAAKELGSGVSLRTAAGRQ